MTVEGRVRTGVGRRQLPLEIRNNFPKAKRLKEQKKLPTEVVDFLSLPGSQPRGCLSTCRDGSDRDDIKWPVAMKMYTLRLWSVRKEDVKNNLFPGRNKGMNKQSTEGF